MSDLIQPVLCSYALCGLTYALFSFHGTTGPEYGKYCADKYNVKNPRARKELQMKGFPTWLLVVANGFLGAIWPVALYLHYKQDPKEQI